MKTVPPNRIRAFTLVEMVIVISILLFFGMISVRVMNLCLRVPRQAAQSQSAFERFDIAVNRLRQDVWAARSLRCPDETTLEIGTEGPAVTWRVESDGALSRTVTDAGQPAPSVRRWESHQQMRFAVDGPTLNFTVVHDAESAQTVMVSQRLLAEGNK
jgi:type II secretory pathway component PulJ